MTINRKNNINLFLNLQYFLILFFSVNSLQGKTIDMRPIYSLNGLKVHEIRNNIYNLKKGENIALGVFPVPINGKIGVNSINNSIYLLGFKKNKVTLDIYKKDFADNISGDCYFLPIKH